MGVNWFRRWARLCMERFASNVRLYDFREELEKRQRDIRYLEFQLAKTRADKFELEQRPAELRDVISAILNETDEQLRSSLRFHVRETASGTGWEVVTDHCCLGGCDMNVRTFQTERDALLFARLLRAVGYRPPHNIACPACYAEQMKDEGGMTHEPAVF